MVGTVYSPGSLRAAIALAGTTGGPDLVELRVDHFADDPGELDHLIALAPRPFIVTARHPREGGAGELSSERRRELYARFAARGAWVDVELRSLEELGGFEGGLIASFHDFEGIPSVPRLRARAASALGHGARIFKVAAMTRTPGDLAILLEFMAKERRLPLAVMGMGPLGRVSRLVLAAAGSALNYGYLGDKAQVSGQWPAALLRERIDELLADGGQPIPAGIPS